MGYLAKPSSTCCLKGTIHDGEPQGKFATVANVETYISQPEEGNANGNIVLYFADIWGISQNARLIMDSLACSGYLTLGLDYFQGDDISKHMSADEKFAEGFDFEAWKAKHIAFAQANVLTWIDEVKVKYGKSVTKYACVGYCFGAPYVMDGLAGDTFAAGAFAHPAFLTEQHFKSAKKPLFLSCAAKDVAFEADARRTAVGILQEIETPHHVQLFSGVEHGFALRGNITNPYERYAKEESLRGITAWFDFWLSQ
ncbi:hypothetical protein BP6252_13832 [Coleophoma cylindrospora]|uniref:Dienelactone hydrolase domain-containing protein n=1 Tax=Coleophoma cylindrospora TaxID=1849047 RepID=A0A3D8Q6Z5_9HELO|nr:hypothetical protein BP6252_13832 [Coleophoma cylindrospora]